MVTGSGGSLEVVDDELEEGGEKVAQRIGVGAGQGVGGRRDLRARIASRLGINRWTVRRLARADEPPRESPTA